ncbi:MAG: hypothetical protein AUK35_02370 [Zetaproteobacteria bacterium CG2_30_46_52]|nr:MAG: hypothetical protein AUK35_02370 [Zetaproteobacteria bacterium CG2_30_46_52]
MNTVLIVIIAVVFAVMFFKQQSIQKQAALHQGKVAPDISAITGNENQTNWVLFFHAKHCGPCRKLKPLMDKMAAEHPNLQSVDVDEYADIARAFQIMGTPTFVAIHEGSITEVKVGGVTRSWLRNHLSAA